MKTLLYILTLSLFTIACSCTKEEPVSGIIINQNQTSSVTYPKSDRPIEINVIVTLNYDFSSGEYVFTADRIFPCDIKFKAYSKYGGVSYFGIKKGTTSACHPFNYGDENSPKDYYLISDLVHWKCNNDEKNEYVDGNITYRFRYATPDTSASDDE